MRIAIFQTNMKTGGIERSLFSLLCSDVFQGHDIDLYLFDKQADYDLESLPNNVTIRYLEKFSKVTRAIPFEMIFTAESITRKDIAGDYDLAIDFDGYSPETACYTLRTKAKRKVIWAHNDYPERAKYDKKFKLMYWAFKSKFAFFDEAVAVSSGVAEALFSSAGVRRDEIRVIPNLVPEQEVLEKAKEGIDFNVDCNKINIVCVGRLDIAKNPEGALVEFASAAQDNPAITLYYLGKGKLKNQLEDKVAELGLDDRVTFLGAKPNPYPYMDQMDALLLNSFYEGQGIVLREGQALGLNLVFPKRLEKYNAGLEGTESVSTSLAGLAKKVLIPGHNYLADYNNDIKSQLSALIKGEK